ncbi:isocitrate dehydrogenase [Ardenticatena maritima]|uniref:Isocitrate dehydrogenase n=1 Tax=Ardenticatena maritima TaxID=872965 RepID=A0A0M8K528_9CHLR|nr:isocitrate dehydrogenase (NAD(+)) [Ardenticatena maritima]KPL87899.1 isocitrate dehydrogenase [Ardenticatena maritima]GAP61775.1 isocitrate dehydrogenase [Ardenticatena maritima]
MTYTVTLIPGDGIGPEVAFAAKRVIDATGVPIEWEIVEAGGDVMYKYGTPLPEETIESIQRNRVALKGPITTPIGSGFRSVNVQLRQRLHLFANYRPAKSIPGVKTPFENVDLIVVRENTEGLYSGIEHVVVPGVVESLKIITREATERVARFAFEMARRDGRKKITAVHKANIMKLSDGLFLEVCRQVAREYPDIQYEEAIVDATAMRLVLNPHQFDVLLMENLYGDILSDLTAGLIGGLGLAPSGNIGEHYAVFEAVHGSAPDIAGQNVANPTALILSGVLMLRHLGEQEAADRVQRAVEQTIAEGIRTRDLGGTATTSEFTDAVIARVQA